MIRADRLRQQQISNRSVIFVEALDDLATEVRGESVGGRELYLVNSCRKSHLFGPFDLKREREKGKANQILRRRRRKKRIRRVERPYRVTGSWTEHISGHHKSTDLDGRQTMKWTLKKMRGKMKETLLGSI
jgi:hypothetical protein